MNFTKICKCASQKSISFSMQHASSEKRVSRNSTVLDEPRIALKHTLDADSSDDRRPFSALDMEDAGGVSCWDRLHCLNQSGTTLSYMEQLPRVISQVCAHWLLVGGSLSPRMHIRAPDDRTIIILMDCSSKGPLSLSSFESTFTCQKDTLALSENPSRIQSSAFSKERERPTALLWVKAVKSRLV